MHLHTYYFHLRDGTDVLLDPDGRVLPTLDAVVGTALNEARAIISADARDGSISLRHRIDVEDELGAVVHSINFEDAVKIERVAK